LIRSHQIFETEAIAAALEDAGYAVLPAVLPLALCDEARSRIDALEPLHWDEVHEGAYPQAAGRHLDRFLCVFNRDPFWLRFIDRPGVIEVAEAVLGPDCHIIGETAWRSHPGFHGEPLHVDYQPPPARGTSAPAAVSPPMFIVTAHFYLSDVTAECGPTRIVPGSHRTVRAPHAVECPWNADAIETVLARAGDALLFRSDVWHAGSDNTTPGAIRYLLQVHYGRREMAQHLSPYLTWRFNPEVLVATTRRQRRLLGDHEPGAYD
jgi:ectoine hydroxylase-related dioxygenase (phytanoyl-CoA dioxygenase family)